MAKKIEADYRKYNTQFFKKWARFYDWTIPLFGVTQIRKIILGLCGMPTDGKRVLDVCTGTGDQALALGKRGFDVVGIDSSVDMLEIAKRKNHYGNVKFRIAGSSDIPYPDDAFDIAVVSFGLHEMPQEIMEKTVAELSRVTRKGGKIVIADYEKATGGIMQFLGFNFCRLFESRYFAPFLKIDLIGILGGHHIHVSKTVHSHFGCLRILDCVNDK